MLLLGRRVGESVVLTAGGDEIIVRVLAVGKGNVNLSFEAPENIIIDRMEIHQKKKENIGNRPFNKNDSNRKYY